MFEEKLRLALEELGQSKIWSINYNTPIVKISRLLGIRARPNHYNSFVSNLIFISNFITVAWYLMMLLLSFLLNMELVQGLLISSILIGITFGFLLATYYSISARINKLSKWEELT